MVATGLLSLNVHEPLTFDGTEIVLHPDLFGGGTGDLLPTVGSSFSTTIAASNTNRLSLNTVGGSTANARGGSGGDHIRGLSLVPTGSSEDKLTTASSNNKTPAPPILQVGDIIEIRVWDPLPRSPDVTSHNNHRSNVSSVLRRRTSPPLHSTATANTTVAQQGISHHPSSGQSSVASTAVNPTSTTISQTADTSTDPDTIVREGAVSSNLPWSRTHSTGHSLQYSETTSSQLQAPLPSLPHVHSETTATSLDDGVANVGDEDASTVSSGDRTHSVTNVDGTTTPATSTTPLPSPKSIKSDDPVSSNKSTVTPTGGDLPPVFPRNLLGNIDAPTTTALPPKPPTTGSSSSNQPRRSNSAGPASPMVVSNDPSQNRPAALLRPRHFRDLSDMTIDTVYESSASTGTGNQNLSSSKTLLDGSHQLVDLHVPLTAATSAPAGLSSTGSNAKRVTGASAAPGTEDDDDSLSRLSGTHSLRLSFVMKVGEKSFTGLKGSARTQISLLRPIADLYHLSSFDMVTVRKVEKHQEVDCLNSCKADFVLVTIKDQFISRGEMHSFLQESLLGSWVYEGKRLFEASRNIQAIARQIRHQDLKVPSGIITEETKITFRSRSARFVWLVQMSSEMWDYSCPYERHSDESKCEIYFDKWIAFVRRLFERWKEVEATHSLTVVFFSRTFVGESPPIWSGSAKGAPIKDRDIYGRQFEDHFRIVIENETSSDWENLVVLLKEAFVKYPSEVGWNLANGPEARRPTSASQGNVLEATNVTLNLLQFHYLDRDLHRTGNSIVIVSAGNGVFEVDKGLASITYERMMVNGIGSDMLSLALPPLHTAPFFLYVNDRNLEGEGSLDFGGTYYEVPHWMHLSFVSYDSEERFVSVDTRHGQKNDASYLMDIDGRPLLANGFLLPSVIDVTNAGATCASPRVPPMAGPVSSVKTTKIVSQARQLISGRDFNDILEACRPRNLGHLPSPLEAIIRMTDRAQSVELKAEGEVKVKSDEIPDLPEWGSLEFDSSSDSPIRHSHRRVVALGQEPGVDVSPSFEPLPSSILASEDDRAENDSLASSPGSQLSSGLGFSYDRPFLASKASPTLTGIQVQRSPSFDIYVTDVDDEASHSQGSHSSSGSSGENRRAVRRRERSEKLIANIRNQMRTYDSKLLVLDTPRLASITDRDLSHHGEGMSQVLPTIGNTSQHQRSMQKNGTQSGGIGAALTQYKTTSSAKGHLDQVDGPPNVSRVASTTRLASMAPSKVHVPELGSRGISPLFLPPVVMSSSEIPLGTSRHRPLKQRLVHPSDYSTSGFESLTKPAARNTLSHSPPLSGSPKLAMSMMSSSSLHRQTSRSSRSMKQSIKSKSKSRRKKAFNPFRQEDEDEVLAKKSHNRRRWSHVFPFGEVEFKRRTGPNWNSLSSPAILPIFIDYFPSQQEVDHNFTFANYNITLSEFENSPYSSNKDFLMEMVRQRLTQDYQLVPPTHLDPSNYRRQSLSRVVATLGETDGSVGVMRQFLSMGHRLQVLSYDLSADVIEVTLYDAKTTRATTRANSFVYHYRCFCQETQSYSKVVQTFAKYAEPYNWNKVDRIICGDEERELREGMRFKRLMFAIVPDRFENEAEEKQYIAKFQRLLEYLNKLRDKAESSGELNIKIVSGAERRVDPSIPIESTPGVERDGMKRFYVRLRKGNLDKLEWMEIVVDATFDTLWSYRIMFHWLVAGSAKVETQVQLLQRRCSQFGLTIVPIPQISVSRNPYLGPFKAPAIITVREANKGILLDQMLYDMDFLHDGVFYTDARMIVTECMDDDSDSSGAIGREFDFGKRWSRPPAGRQFLHRSGTLFVRIVTDLNGRVLVIVLGNYLYMSKDPKLKLLAQTVFQKLSSGIETLGQQPPVDNKSGLQQSLSLTSSQSLPSLSMTPSSTPVIGPVGSNITTPVIRNVRTSSDDFNGRP